MELNSIMEECGAILRGHFQLTSGRHSEIYLEKFQDTSLVKIDSFIVKRNGNFKLETKITDHFSKEGPKF